jgi:phosphatidylinositol 3-kinase
MNKFIIDILDDKFNDDNLPIIYPFDIKYKIVKILKREILNSNTKPILIKAEIINNHNNKKIINFIIKKNKSLRKEQLIACLIDILLYKLNNTNIQLIPSYKIIMLNKDIGIIEYIENSYTLRSINEKGFTLQNYILNLNLNDKMDTIKTRFVHSLSISSAIAYIIGLGDRHLDNIMINNLGQIFHIDYGYIMDNPIKLFNIPEIKLTNDIIDFLGGNNSLYYNEFKKIIVQIYNLYRANKNILYIFFKFIADSENLEWNQISSKLDTKLMIGMKCKDVEITLINEIDSSNSITDMFTDICHNYKQKFFK